MAPISNATMQDTSVDLNWEWAKHHPKQLSSGKQITILGDYWYIKKIMTSPLTFIKIDDRILSVDVVLMSE